MPIFALFIGCTIVGALSAIVGILYERRRWERRLLEQAAGIRASQIAEQLPLRDASTNRLDRLEQAVEAIAIEMERVGEGQRFMTKILSERRTDRTPPSPIPGAVRSAPRQPT